MKNVSQCTIYGNCYIYISIKVVIVIVTVYELISFVLSFENYIYYDGTYASIHMNKLFSRIHTTQSDHLRSLTVCVE